MTNDLLVICKTVIITIIKPKYPKIYNYILKYLYCYFLGKKINIIFEKKIILSIMVILDSFKKKAILDINIDMYIKRNVIMLIFTIQVTFLF